MASIDLNNKTLKEEKNYVSILTTDLSSTYDLVDHKLLLRKLEFYGVKNSAIELLEDFLNNRKIFTQVQGFNSEIKDSENCSVIQGSKLTVFLHTIFLIEIPLIPKLMRDAQLIETLLELKIPQYYGIGYFVNQYIDDSTNIIGCSNKVELQNYLKSYHEVLEEYYKANKLKLNSEKTKIIVTKAKNNTNDRSPVEFKTAEGETIREDNAIRILGFLKNNRDSYDSHLGQINGRVCKVLSEIRPYLKHMNLKTRRETIYAKAASLLLYGSELFTGQTEWTQRKITSILIKCNREIYRKNWFKVSN